MTHPDLNKAFKKLSIPSVMKLVLEYPTGLHMKEATVEELYETLIKAGAKGVAKKAANTLAKVMPNTIAVPAILLETSARIELPK